MENQENDYEDEGMVYAEDLPNQYCPNCGKFSGVPVLWGEPTEESYDPERFIYGGCCLPALPGGEYPLANMGCKECGYWWYVFPPGYKHE